MNFPREQRGLRLSLAIVFCVITTGTASLAQQGAAIGEPLVILNTDLPKGYLGQPYQFQLQAKGGITPVKWVLNTDSLPIGVKLNEDGSLVGVPTETGSFSFTVIMADSGRPVQKKVQPLKLRVLEPLLVDWGQPPRVNGQRIEGSFKVSNQTDEDFDLTTVVLAVSDAKRATAIGIEHFNLKKQTLDFEIPFGDDLPFGTYQVNLNVVAIVPSNNSVLKDHLTAGPLRVVQVP
ncbi:MAG: hypothetical protein JWO91_1062 [Acidobacteriaceae bacterium]|nr:hypothetical protein [Acidobacteriaceae bacterium]